MTVGFNMEIDQPEASGFGGKSWDVIVVGAGPAGAGAALWLSREGLRVLLLDKKRFPREKTCGDGLTPEALDNLKKLNLYEKIKRTGHTVSRVRAFSPSRHEISVNCECVTLRRKILDAFIVQEAVSRGAVFSIEEVVKVEESAKQVSIKLKNDKEFTAKVVIMAGGPQWKLPETIGIVDGSTPAQFAVRRYLRSPLRLDELVFSMERSIMPGYAWIFPMGDDLYNIGCGMFHDKVNRSGSYLQVAFREFISNFPMAKEMVERGKFVSSLKGSPLRCGLRGVSGSTYGRVVAAGEAAATTIPFSGEGIGKALASGIRAAEAVERAISEDEYDSLKSFPEGLRAAWELTYEGYERARRWAGNPTLIDFLMKKAGETPALTDALNRIVNRKIPPTNVFSARGLFKAVFSR